MPIEDMVFKDDFPFIPAYHQSGGGNGRDSVETRLAVFDVHIQNMRTEMQELKTDVRELRADLKSSVRWLIGGTFILAGIMAKGFGWLEF